MATRTRPAIDQRELDIGLFLDQRVSESDDQIVGADQIFSSVDQADPRSSLGSNPISRFPSPSLIRPWPDFSRGPLAGQTVGGAIASPGSPVERRAPAEPNQARPRTPPQDPRGAGALRRARRVDPGNPDRSE